MLPALRMEREEISPPLPQSLKLGHPRDDAAAGGALAPHQPAWGAAGTPFPPLWDLKVLSCPNVSIRRPKPQILCSLEAGRGALLSWGLGHRRELSLERKSKFKRGEDFPLLHHEKHSAAPGRPRGRGRGQSVLWGRVGQGRDGGRVKGWFELRCANRGQGFCKEAEPRTARTSHGAL